MVPTDSVQRRSFFKSPGVINRHISISQIGHAMTSPANPPIFIRSMNISKGLVARRRHSLSAENVARADGGNEQYGSLRISPRLGSRGTWRGPMAQAGIPCSYQINPIIVVTAMAARARNSRVRSSRKWSTMDMVPSGFFLALRDTCPPLLTDVD